MKSNLKTICLSALLLSAPAFALKYESDVPPDVQKVLKTDLEWMKTVKGTDRSKRHAKIYGDVAGADYLKFFNDRIDTIGYAGDMGDSVMAYVQPFDPHTMYLTSNITKYNTPQAWRMATLWHESRHSESENGNWSHVNCPKDIKDTHGNPLVGPLSGKPLANQPACDDVADGAYGATGTMFGNLARYCTDACGEKFKADAEIIFQDGINRLVNDDLREELAHDLPALD